MNTKTEQVITDLESLTQDLYYSLVGDEPYVVVDWQTEEKGEFALEKFLVNQKALTLFASEEFIELVNQSQSSNTAEIYQKLLELFRDNLTELQIYGYGFPELSDDLFGGSLPIEEEELDALGFPFFIGLSDQGEWIGIAPQQSYGYESSTEIFIPELESVGEKTATIIREIAALMGNMEHKMKSDQWNFNNHWQIIVTDKRESVITELMLATNFLTIREVDDFFRLEEQLDELEEDEEVPEDIQKIVAVQDIFQSQLSNSQVYNLDFVISRESFTVHYILGETQAGDWVGLMTDSYTF